MEEWKEYKVAEVIEEISMGPFGSNIKRDNYVDSGVPYLNGSNLSSYKLNEDSFNYVSEKKAKSLGRCVARRGDIIVTHRGTIGQISYIPYDSKYEHYLTGNSQFRLTVNNKIIRPDFFVYFFHTRMGQHRLLANASQVGVPALARPTSTFKEVHVPVPSMDVQIKVMEILHSLDDKIEVNRRINNNLEQLTQALFKSWFVDFEPFKEGEFVDSELGMIPKGWRIGTLGDLAIISSGKRPLNKGNLKMKGYPYPLIGASCIMGYTSDFLYDSKILITGRVGTHGVVMRFDCPCWPSDNTLVIQSNYYEYVYQCLNIIDYKNLNRGSTQPLITQTDLKNVEIVIPSECALKEFESKAASLMELVASNRIESNRLATLRDTLLPRLMSGKLNIDEIN